MSLSIIIGSGLLALLCFYFAFSVDEKHFLLKFLFVLFALIFMFMLAVGTGQNACSVEVTSQTVNGSTTNFVNEYLCHETNTNTGSSLITLTGALFMLFGIYITIYILMEVFDSRKIGLGKK